MQHNFDVQYDLLFVTLCTFVTSLLRYLCNMTYVSLRYFDLGCVRRAADSPVNIHHGENGREKWPPRVESELSRVRKFGILIESELSQSRKVKC